MSTTAKQITAKVMSADAIKVVFGLSPTLSPLARAIVSPNEREIISWTPFRYKQ